MRTPVLTLAILAVPAFHLAAQGTGGMMGGTPQHDMTAHHQSGQMMTGNMMKGEMMKGMVGTMTQMNQMMQKMAGMMDQHVGMDMKAMGDMAGMMEDMSALMKDMATQMKQGQMPADMPKKRQGRIDGVTKQMEALQAKLSAKK